MSRDSRRQRLVLVVLLLASFTLLTVDYRSNDSSPLRPLESAVAAVVGPAEHAVAGVVRPLGDLTHLGDNASKVNALRAQIERLKAAADVSAADHRRAQELDRLLRLATYYKLTPARVVAWGDALGYERTVTIDAGRDDGLAKNMTVVAGASGDGVFAGLVGRTVQVDASSSVVQLADDNDITVGVRLASNGQIGTVTGRPDGTLELTLISQTATAHVGDNVLTFGSKPGNMPYVPNVPVGKVISVVNTPGAPVHTAVVRPFVDFTSLDTVAVVAPSLRRDPRNALVAPRPKPTPTVTVTVTASPPATQPGQPGGSTTPSGTPSGTPGGTPTGTPTGTKKP